MTQRAPMTLLTVYDGASRIGGNKIHLEEKIRGVLLHFGMNFEIRRVLSGVP